MEKSIELFWEKLKKVLELCASRVVSARNDVKFYIGTSSNELFPLRAYLSFIKDSEQGEISITVDVVLREQGIVIESDIVNEEGKLISGGPSLFLPDIQNDALIQKKIENWLEDFKNYIDCECDNINNEINEL